jgi:ribonuclease D
VSGGLSADGGNAELPDAELPLYEGIALANIVLIDSAAAAEQAFRALQIADVLGFDTESKPTFLKGEQSDGPHLIQLATDAQAFLFPVRNGYGLDQLKIILESKQILKVGFGLGSDRSRLQSRLGITPEHLLDLGVALKNGERKGVLGAKSAVAAIFGQRLQKSKKATTSNWANPRLTERQILYAANDAHVALRVYRAWLTR